MINKTELRQELRTKRRDLSPFERQTLSQQAANNLQNSPVFQQSQHIALYFANDGELDPSTILFIAEEQKKQCYFPVLAEEDSAPLHFVRYQSGDELKTNRYGIPEPHLNNENIFAAEELDLVLVPLVGFDEKGDRLGMGKGYYDRTFAFLHDAKNINLAKPKLIGLAFECQKVTSMKCDSWDIPLHGIVTGKQFYSIKKP